MVACERSSREAMKSPMPVRPAQLQAGIARSAIPRRLVRMLELPRTNLPPIPWIVPVFTRFKVNEVRQPYEWALHRHADDFEVIIVDRGTYLCRLNDRALALRPGEILVVKPGDEHADTCRTGLRYLSIGFHLDRDLLNREATRLFRDTATPEQQRVRVNKREFWPVFERLRAEAVSRDRFAAHVQDALLAEFFWRLVRALPQKAVCPEFTGISEDQDFRSRFQHVLQQHAGTRFSVADMAQQMGMSVSSLAHTCKALLGVAPAHALLRCRIERAQALLRTTDLPVKEIGTRIGFQEPHHFLRTFKRLAGATPSAFRQRA